MSWVCLNLFGYGFAAVVSGLISLLFVCFGCLALDVFDYCVLSLLSWLILISCVPAVSALFDSFALLA